MAASRKLTWTIALSFTVAMALTAVPLPEWAVAWRPVWIALALGYWAMAVPENVGVGVGWFVGLLADVLQGALLGQHALGFAIVAYLFSRNHKRLRMFPLWQQAVFAGMTFFTSFLIMLWVRLLIGMPPLPWTYWLPCFTSMLLWPWVFIILRDVRRKAMLV
jgi:rod shape-determining protein MreD